MKDQYFGDKTDYIKHGVLRQIAQAGFALGLHWMWTSDDGSSDGSRVSYLNRPADFRHYDAHLFDLLVEHISRQGDRRLRIIEEKDVIPGAVSCFEAWQADAASRSEVLDRFLDRIRQPSLIFVDPDNGLNSKTARIGRKGAEKYVFTDEIARIWQAGHSVLLYQHFPRVKRDPYVAAQFERLRSHTFDAGYVALVTSHVAFMACLQASHESSFRKLAEDIEARWSPHVTVRRWDPVLGRFTGSQLVIPEIL